jgi:hypothetical protein
MRGQGRQISTVLTDALIEQRGARAAALAAAFSEACGWPLSREASLRGLTQDGRLIIVASSQAWADQVNALGPRIRARVNARLGRPIATGMEIRVGPLAR